MRYTVVLEPDEEGQGYTVRVPALPGCVTEGRTREEALANAREAITGFIGGAGEGRRSGTGGEGAGGAGDGNGLGDWDEVERVD